MIPIVVRIVYIICINKLSVLIRLSDKAWAQQIFRILDRIDSFQMRWQDCISTRRYIIFLVDMQSCGEGVPPPYSLNLYGINQTRFGLQKTHLSQFPCSLLLKYVAHTYVSTALLSCLYGQIFGALGEGILH